MSGASGVVIGGSPRFVTSLIVQLASESGQWPEVAADAEQAISLARRDAWLLVLELQDEALAARVGELRQERGSSLAIVLTAPPGSGSARVLERSADVVVTPDGVPAGVLEVVRRLAAARRPPATVPAPAPARPEPAPKPASGEPPAEPAPAFTSSSVWPGTVLPPEEAQSVLMGAVAGLWPSEALRPLTERVVASLSEVERRALRGDAIAVEPAPICLAAAMRLVVTAALESAPAAGGAVDGASVRVILGEIDAALVDLKRVGEGAVPAVQPELQSVRHVLVKEAIDLTDAVHRIVPSEAPPEPVPQTPTPRPLRQETGKKRRYRVLWLLLAIAAAGGAALQGYVYLLRAHR